MKDFPGDGKARGAPGLEKKDMRSISDVDWAGKFISEGSGAVG